MTVQPIKIQVDKWAKKAKVSLRAAVQVVMNDVVEQLVINTPGPGNSIRVDPPPGEPTGTLRASWYVSLDGITDGPKQAPDKSQGGAVTVGRMSIGLNEAEIGDIIYVLNNAEYAYHVENGTVNQAPRMFVRSTVNEAPSIAKRALARVKV